ncbi:Spore protein SP21 [Lacunisphaera limnophila]|uniref:Spore protein SP21 n=1 Tax=Lacunisphaera limnophila TaxID=1838286 RepID=A0A1D8AU72_9BACT|nr:Hsp20/alpha crystallin family protein [Lacunisphaera limnophila]AOS44445.1 Spore protein SP21 [Lacunisphaera limnophila]
MSILNQIVPRLSRTLSGRSDSTASAAASQPEFTLKPAYEITENTEAWGLIAQLPGVTKEGLELTAEEGRVTVRGRRAWQKPEAWTAVYRESVDAPYELTLEHDNTVDADKIHAELKDGVLRVSLPKAEALKPRKIAVN